MSNPWRESFDDLRYENGNTYDYFENISEAAPYAVDFRKVREAVYQIKQKAKRDNVRLPVAMNQYFSTANLGPAERAAIRAKIMGMREDVELDEEQMTSSDKAKEKRLKSKYDKSGMKKSMIDQYGEKKGKQVYFAKIRKMAMEGLESFDDETVSEDVYNEGKVPWHDPSRPLESGWTPAEKNAAKRKRTGVEDLSKQPSERDMERYGKMKSAADNEEMRDRVKKERQNKKKGILSLFNKREKESAEERPHEFKKVNVPDYRGGGTTTKGSERRAKGTKEGDKSGYVSKTWNKGTSKAQSPIDPEDRRTRGRGSGPNPKTRKESFSLESFVEEKYGEKYEKKYKKSGKKSKDYDGDGDIEDESHEYAGAKDRAIKKAMRKEASDWRADLGFFTEKRYLESPRVETMPPEKQNDSEQAPKERAANKRLKPKSSEVKENFENIAESLGGQLVEWEELNEGSAVAGASAAVKRIINLIDQPGGRNLKRAAQELRFLKRFDKTPEIPTKAKKDVFRTTVTRSQRSRGVIPKPKPTGKNLGTEKPTTTIKPPNVVSAKQKVEIPKDQFVAPEIPKPVRTPKPKPTPTKPTKPSVEPQRQPEVPTPTKPQTKPAKSLPAVIDLDTGIIQKVIPQGTSVKTPKPTGQSKQPKSQTQTQPQRVTNVPPTGIGINISTPTTGDGGKKDWELPKLGMPRAGYGQGRTWVARSL